MALDPSIILSGQQQPSFADTFGKTIQLKALANQGRLQDLQYQQTQQEMEGARKLRDLYSGNINADGSINRAGILQGAASQGLGDKIPGLQKSWAETDKATADLGDVKSKIDERQFGVLKEKNQLVQGAIASLAGDPNLSYDQVRNTIVQLSQQGLIDDAHAVQYVRSIPQTANQAQLKQFLYQAGLQAADAGKRLEMLTPQFKTIDAGGQVITGTVDPMSGQFSGSGAVQKTNSPDALLNAQTQRQLASQGVSIQTDAAGNMIVVPNRAPAGSPVTASPVLDAAGDPVRSKQSQLNAKQIQAAQGKLQTVAILRKQLDNLKAARANLGGASEGIVMGRNPVSESGSNYDAALAALQSTIRQLTRTPGEGAMSDYESRIAQQQLPQRADYGSSIDQKIAQIEDLANVIESGYSGMIEPGQSTPAKSAARPPLSAFQR